MAQTKRKRRSKHRGNAAGRVETRGRTSKPLSGSGGKSGASRSREVAKEDRLTRKPTWKRSAFTAGFAAVLMFVVLSAVGKKHSITAAALFAVVVLAIYLPISYYLETFLWRKRMAKRGLKT